MRQRIIATLGRLDELKRRGQIEGIIRSLARFSEKAEVIKGYARGEIEAREVKRIGPDLVLGRLWQDLKLDSIISGLASRRRYGFDLEGAIYLATLSRLFFPGSDRRTKRLARDYQVRGRDEIELHHLYRAMDWLGKVRERIEEELFAQNRHLFTSLSLVFFDTTSLYFEGRGGELLGKRGYSKDRRPDENQMIVGAVLDEKGRPLASPMWPGNTTDAKTLIPVAASLRERFGIGDITLVADRGMVGEKNLKGLEEAGFTYILGVKMRLEKKAMREVLSRPGRFKEVTENLKVKEVFHQRKRYIVCLNLEQQKRDTSEREAILASLEEKLQKGAASLIGNTGYRHYLKIEKGCLSIDAVRVKEEERYDGKWVLITSTDLPAEEVALRYKDLWQVEAIFKTTKSILETRPVFHQRDASIMGHVFVSFLALVLMKELRSRLDFPCEWDEIRQDLDALYEVEVKTNGKTWFLRSPLRGITGKVLSSVRVAPPPTARPQEM